MGVCSVTWGAQIPASFIAMHQSIGAVDPELFQRSRIHNEQYWKYVQTIGSKLHAFKTRLLDSLELEHNQMLKDMSSFNQYHCQLQCPDRTNPRVVELTVPGLAEKRPEIIYGDQVRIRMADQRRPIRFLHDGWITLVLSGLLEQLNSLLWLYTSAAIRCSICWVMK